MKAIFADVTTLHPAAVEFIERLALVVESAGIPRVGGRILGLLIVEGEPLSCRELAARLQVSRGSVSMNTRLLESRGVIHRLSRLGERRDLFGLDDGFPERMIARSLEAQRAMLQLAAEARSRLPARCVRARSDLDRIESFSRIAVETMELMLEKWRNSTHVVAETDREATS
ncbi:MAG: winged helix-turn-helix transcriptional regulator [Thermoanaerobaculia bacterium]|nr:winged helix-turn-helix transcriptional regulator [Thermoanaerobaculia bacterium]